MYNNFKIIKPGNTGLQNETPEQRDPRDYILGAAETKKEIKFQDGHGHADNAPTQDFQTLADGDGMFCVANSCTNGYEYDANYWAKKNQEIYKYLLQEKYIDENNNVKFNACIVAVGSGTDPNRGNSVSPVVEWIRKNGLAPQSARDWNNSWTKAQFYKLLNQVEIDAGKPILKIFTPAHEWLPTKMPGFSSVSTPIQMIEGLKYGVLRVSVDGNYDTDENGLISATLKGIGKLYYWNHSVTLRDYKLKDGVTLEKLAKMGYNEQVNAVEYWEVHDHYTKQILKFVGFYPFGDCKLIYFVLTQKKNKSMIYKQNGSSALYIKHWSKDLLIPFKDGKLPGGDVFKSLYSVDNYSDMPRLNYDVLPFPVADYGFTTD